MIEIRDLHLSLVGGAGPVNILRGVNLSVQSGETISIVGPSGAGKTTLLMALSGRCHHVITGVALAGGAYVITFVVYVIGDKRYESIVRATVLNGFLAYCFYGGARRILIFA